MYRHNYINSSPAEVVFLIAVYIFQRTISNNVIDEGHVHQPINNAIGEIIDLFSAPNLALAGFPEPTLSVKICILAAKTCLIYAFVTQQPLNIPFRHLCTCIFVASTLNVLNHIVLSAFVWLYCRNKMW